LAVKRRRFGKSVSSAVGTTGAGTTRASGSAGGVASDAATPASGSCEGITMGSFSCNLKCKLEQTICLTLIGMEGGVNRVVFLSHLWFSSRTLAVFNVYSAQPIKELMPCPEICPL
ncbi:MAG: hypothetical protein ACI8Q6_003199, partial [Granulosicoccus sp.]